MDFDIVIATRNRVEALRLSLPLMLSQSCRPRSLIVVDSSDNHREVARTVTQIAQDVAPGARLVVLRSAPGSSLQRNTGLDAAVSPVVMLPDDDALWFPGFSDSVMRIYERDAEETIGGVGGTEVAALPPGMSGGAPPAYRMAVRDVLQLSVGRFIDSLEYRLFPDPFFVEADARSARIGRPAWLADVGATPATALPGFRMSFRTDLIRKTGFDETLGAYALFEDYDASLAVLGSHLLVDAQSARVFHYRAPEARVNGTEWGVMQVLNRAYLVCKHAGYDSEARRRMRGYALYKTARYAVRAHTGYGRRRAWGAARAVRCIAPLMGASAAELPEMYARLRESCMSGGR